MLTMLGHKSREYARYSPPLAFLSFFSYTRLLRSDVGALESRRRRSPVLATSSRPPIARSSLEVPRQEACAFLIDVVICASLLKANMFTCVCTQILLLPLTFVWLELLYSSPRGPGLVI